MSSFPSRSRLQLLGWLATFSRQAKIYCRYNSLDQHCRPCWDLTDYTCWPTASVQSLPTTPSRRARTQWSPVLRVENAETSTEATAQDGTVSLWHAGTSPVSCFSENSSFWQVSYGLVHTFYWFGKIYPGAKPLSQEENHDLHYPGPKPKRHKESYIDAA